MKSLIMCLGILLSSSAFATKIVGNGGDLCELRFNTIKNDIFKWINDGGAAGFNFPAGLTVDQYKAMILPKIATAYVSCTNEKVSIGQSEKTCMNYVDENGQPRIICNLKRFLETDESEQYVLVHHEYAGLAGIEVNQGEASDYILSSQITGYLESAVVKKLVVKPSSDPCNIENTFTDSEKLMAAISANNLQCVEKINLYMGINGPFETRAFIYGVPWGPSMSPLAWAVALNRVEIVQILLNKGADPEFVFFENYGPLHVAATMGSAESARVLLEHHAEVNRDAQYNVSPLWLAAGTIYNPWISKQKAYDTIATLLEFGADPNRLSLGGQVILAQTVQALPFLELMLSHGANPNLASSFNGEAAIFSCRAKFCVDRLVAAGADVNVLNKAGKSPLDVAYNDEVRQALLSYGARSGGSGSAK